MQIFTTKFVNMRTFICSAASRIPIIDIWSTLTTMNIWQSSNVIFKFRLTTSSSVNISINYELKT